MQDSAMARTAYTFMNVLVEVFGEQVINRGLQPAHLPSLNLYHLRGTLKHNVYMNNPHSLQELK
jgi:hypothetical protein